MAERAGREERKKGVHAYLVTGSAERRQHFWGTGVGAAGNWLESRKETTKVMVLEEDSMAFLDGARHFGLTVEEIEGASSAYRVTVGQDGEINVQEREAPGESYRLVVGEPGTGWQPDVQP